MPVFPMLFAFETVMVELPSAEIRPVPTFEAAVIVFVVNAVAIVAMPGRVGIISITRIVSFEVDGYLNLRFGRSSHKATGDHHHYN
jgi:hypothetical protein